MLRQAAVVFYVFLPLMSAGKYIYFASDFHLGVPDHSSSREREDRIVRWLSSIKESAAEIFLVGDVFDFWFEYATVIPKGYIRLLGKLAELSDSGVRIVMFKGNHDMWMFDYFTKELAIEIVSDELIMERNGKKFYLHHGDGLGPGDPGYKILKSFFRSRFCQWLFARLHPNLGIALAKRWSSKSRLANDHKEKLKAVEQEWLVTYSKLLLKESHFDYLIFGHRHLPLDVELNDSHYINLGEWINYNSYAVFDGNRLELKRFESEESIDKMTVS
jgi:UDP-2,3-diacylglucosamine hydrolase